MSNESHDEDWFGEKLFDCSAFFLLLLLLCLLLLLVSLTWPHRFDTLPALIAVSPFYTTPKIHSKVSF